MRTHLKHAAILIALGVLGYWQLWVPGATLYSPHSDFVAWGMANKHVLYRSLGAGDGLPFWRADQLAGYGALANPNSLYTYPLHWPFAIFSATSAAGPVAWLHFALSGLSFYLLGIALQLSPLARFLMAVAGLFSFKLILATYAGFLFMPSAALVPAFGAALAFAWQRPGPHALLAVATTGYLCAHGHPQIFLYATVAAGLWSVALLWLGVQQGQPQRALRSVAVLAGGAALSLALVAHTLLPLSGETGLVTRGERTYEAYLAGHSVGARHLLTMVFPEALGSPLDHSYPTDELWEDVMYFGLGPLLLACAALALSRRRRLCGGLVLSLALAVVLACDTPLSQWLFAHVPGVNYLRHPGRILFLVPVFGIALAGLGFDALAEHMRSTHWLHRIAAALLVLIAAEGVWWAQRYVTMAPTEIAFPTPPFVAGMRRDASTYRVLTTSRSVLNYGWAAHLGLQVVGGYDHINYRHYQVYMDVLRQGVPGPARAVGWTDVRQVKRWDLVDALNVKYVVSDTPVTAPPGQLRELGRWGAVPKFFFFYGLRSGPAFLYENLRARPRAYFAASVSSVDAHTELTSLLHANLTDTALSSTPPSTPPAPLHDDGTTRVNILSQRDGRLELSVATTTHRLLVLSEVWHPGWQAWLDDTPLGLERVNVALMGAQIPAGEHRLTLRFEPPEWRLGLALSGIGATLWLLVLLLCVRRGLLKGDGPR